MYKYIACFTILGSNNSSHACTLIFGRGYRPPVSIAAHQQTLPVSIAVYLPMASANTVFYELISYSANFDHRRVVHTARVVLRPFLHDNRLCPLPCVPHANRAHNYWGPASIVVRGGLPRHRESVLPSFDSLSRRPRKVL